MTKKDELFEKLLEKYRADEAQEGERVNLAVAAGKLPDKSGTDLLRELLEDPSEEVRRYAVHGLCIAKKDRSPEMIERLWTIFEEDPDEDVRSMALACLASALFGSRDKNAFAKFKATLGNKDVSPLLKRSIFDAILQLIGTPPSEWTAVTTSWRDLAKFEVDWARVAEIEAALSRPTEE